MIAVCVLILMMFCAVGMPLAWDRAAPTLFLLYVFCFLAGSAYFFIRSRLK